MNHVFIVAVPQQLHERDTLLPFNPVYLCARVVHQPIADFNNLRQIMLRLAQVWNKARPKTYCHRLARPKHPLNANYARRKQRLLVLHQCYQRAIVNKQRACSPHTVLDPPLLHFFGNYMLCIHQNLHVLREVLDYVNNLAWLSTARYYRAHAGRHPQFRRNKLRRHPPSSN
ncbi:hypothetical protein AYI70_g8099 [Smittium culicis]|uniref:Uncharacterized protein n=1 Tax=Smittium culicis TaxID=133412 RepID=A0A1R1XHI3_9FUNG|nr:hypothetical protein AYI70_g8099 [Smittium culicis]